MCEGGGGGGGHQGIVEDRGGQWNRKGREGVREKGEEERGK